MLLQIFRHTCCLVAWSDIFLLEFPSQDIFRLNQIVRDLLDFLSLFLSLFLSFFLSRPPLHEKENLVNPGLSGWAKKRPKMAIPAKKIIWPGYKATRRRNICSNIAAGRVIFTHPSQRFQLGMISDPVIDQDFRLDFTAPFGLFSFLSS